MRRFVLDRAQDLTGVSGTGIVAEGVLFEDGTTVVKWKPTRRGQKTSTSVWPTMGAMVEVHCHHNLTQVVFLDGQQ